MRPSEAAQRYAAITLSKEALQNPRIQARQLLSCYSGRFGGGCAEFCVNGQSTAGASLLVRNHNDNPKARSTPRTIGPIAGRLQKA